MAQQDASVSVQLDSAAAALQQRNTVAVQKQQYSRTGKVE